MSDAQGIERAIMAILIEAYRLGLDFASERHAQPDSENYDGLCEYVSQETAALCRELVALAGLEMVTSETRAAVEVTA